MTGRAMVMVCCCMAVAGCSQIGGLLNGGDEDVAGLPRADLVDTDGASVGTVTFEQTPNGMLVRADVHDLPRGTHGFHIPRRRQMRAPRLRVRRRSLQSLQSQAWRAQFAGGARRRPAQYHR